MVKILLLSGISYLGHILINFHIIALVIIFLKPLHIGGRCKFWAKDSKMPYNLKMMLIFSKCGNVSVGQTLIF